MQFFLENILPCVVTLITALGGSKLIFAKEEKKKAENEGNKGEIDNLKVIIQSYASEFDSMDRRIDALSATNDKYFNEIQKQRDEKIVLREEITELKVEKERLNAMKCEVKGCGKRQPPSEAMK